MSMINTLSALLQGMNQENITVHQERCITLRHRKAECLRCVNACTTGSLSLAPNGTLAVDPSLCIGCGTCATACPTSAIELREPNDDALTRSLKTSIITTKGHPVIACEAAQTAAKRTIQEGAAVITPCLGRIDESLLVGAAAYKAFDITLVCGACETCEHNQGGILAFDVAESASSLLSAYGVSFAIEFADEIPERVIDSKDAPASNARDNDTISVPNTVPDPTTSSASHSGAPITSRREFFTGAKEALQEAASTALHAEAADHGFADDPQEPDRPIHYQHVGKDGTLPHFVPTRRIRLYNYLKHVGAGEPVAESVTSRAIGAVNIDTDKCSSCRMCAVFCPTAAISKIDTDDIYGIMHRPSACVQCRACESICPKGAITVSDEVPTRQFIGKEAVVVAMERPTWTPNKPDSIYNKIHTLLGEDLQMCMF